MIEPPWFRIFGAKTHIETGMSTCDSLERMDRALEKTPGRARRRRIGLFACTWIGLLAASETPAEPAPTYVGAAACGGCHPDALRAWRGSHHDLAMQEATSETVLGDFADATHHPHGVTTTFRTEGGRFFIETPGNDGTPARFEVAYTFGVDPLQQYLVKFPDGRMQAFGLAWDTRSKEHGGQRWFSIYGDEPIPPGDVLHWTGPAQNWNHQCADCHSTALRKGYDAENDRFETRWAELNVACEACHGPGSLHTKRMQSGDPRWRMPGRRGLGVEFEPVASARWPEGPDGLPVREPPRTSHTEVELCARCHSRRSTLVEAAPAGTPLHDTHRIATLEPPLYFDDGQIHDEVYVYGSYVQSAMYAAGVSCSDCHEPHSSRLRAQGNALCARCHSAARFDTAAHHHHAEGSAGSQCVSCHMPTRTYMQVDPRRDHSLRVPRPALAGTIGAPNACNDCHSSMTNAWAARQIREWSATRAASPDHYGARLHAGRRGEPGAEHNLSALIESSKTPGIVRATALGVLPQVATDASLETFARALEDPDPMVRAASLRALATSPEALALANAARLLDDPVRLVRWEAAMALAPAAAMTLSKEVRTKRDALLSEYEVALRRDADRPESHMTLASLAMARGEEKSAEQSLLDARARNPHFVPAYVNLADLYRAQARGEASEAVLREALERLPDQPDLLHAHGLALVRLGRGPEALDRFATAARSSPENPRYAYVYAVALHDAGRSTEALEVLRAAAARHPGHREIAAFLDALERTSPPLRR